MTTTLLRRRWQQIAILASLTCLLAIPSSAWSTLQEKAKARDQFETAEKMREELNGLPSHERTRREYQRVMDAYRRVYYMAPTSSKADASVVAVGELLAEVGRTFEDEKSLRSAIAQFEFLRREYPGSKYRVDALFTIGQIYKDDLDEADKARDTFQEFMQRYPHDAKVADAREAIAELTQPVSAKAKGPREAKALEDRRATLPMVNGIRHWSTPDYTRVAIDLEQEVKYEAGRVANPDRIFFDLHDSKLASTLVGKTFDVSDGFLRRIRVAQFQKGLVRVVLEVDDVSDYSAFFLPNPYRLIIDIHGRKPTTPQTLVAKAQKSEEKTETTPAAASNAKPEPPAKQDTTTAALTPEATKSDIGKTETSSASTVADDAPRVGPVMRDGSFYSKDAVVTKEPATAQQATKAPETKLAKATADTKTSTSRESTKTQIANLKGTELKATDKPTTEPTVEVVAPRGSEKPDKKTTAARKGSYPAIHQAQPTADGQRSLIRALGLKIGRIVIDAGHGGHDTGTIGPNGLLEKDLVLDVALRTGKLLQQRLGADVVFTRDDDTFVPLETRTAIANQQQADLFLSIHANSSQDPAARGIETYYLNLTSSADALEVAARENAVSEKSIHELQDLVKKIALKEKIEESREFASDVQHSLYTGIAAKDRTIRDRGVKKAPFIVLIGANMPSILAEISFVSNPTDERRLQTPEYRQKIAESLYRGVSRYISGLSGLKVAKLKTDEAN